MHPLWFDREKYPDKHDLLTAMLQDEMEIIRAGETQFKEQFPIFNFFFCVFFLPGNMIRMKDADWQSV